MGVYILSDDGHKWIRNISILATIWGIVNILFSSLVFGIIFIIIAALIYIYKSYLAVYALGIVLWILAFIQILSATGTFNTGFTDGLAKGTELILIAIINFAVGLFIIYRARKLTKV